jgi:hypothetical protein
MKTRHLLLGLALALSITGKASAHGVEEPHELVGAEGLSEFNWWEFLISDANAEAWITIDARNNLRLIKADGLPLHATGQFPNRGNPNTISAQSYSFQIPLNPKKTGRINDYTRQPFGIALNGVPFDPGTAGYWRNDFNSGWHIEAIAANGTSKLGLDSSNAHVQRNGAYHYHGIPNGLMDRFAHRTEPVLLGYAADGFPVYGPLGYTSPNNSGSKMTNLRSSYRLKSGQRPGGAKGPGGAYDGTYEQDYEYVAGLGDLDQCNGRTGVTPEYPEGIYYYVITDSFPFISRCFVGTPDRSFERRQGPGGGGRPGGGPQGRVGTGGPGVGGPGAGGPGGPGGPGAGGPPGGRPDLEAAAAKLGITSSELRRALGPPPPDISKAAETLGISVDALVQALKR